MREAALKDGLLGELEQASDLGVHRACLGGVPIEYIKYTDLRVHRACLCVQVPALRVPISVSVCAGTMPSTRACSLYCLRPPNTQGDIFSIIAYWALF